MGSLRRALGGLVLLALAAGAACSGDATDPGGNNNNPGSITLTLSAAALSIVQGAGGSVTATLARAGNFTGAIAIAVEGLPANVTAAASPASVGAGATSSTITFTAAAGAATGNTTITIRASGTGVTERTASLTLTITAATQGAYTMAVAPGTLSFAQGAQATSTATLTRTGGFAGSVAFSATGAPNGMTIAFNPTSTTGNTTTITAVASSTVATGNHTVTIRGTATGLADRTATLTVTITPASPGGNATFRVCNASPVLFAATQDGTGAWTVATVTNNTFTFNVASGRGGVAYVTSNGASQYQTIYFYGTQAQLNHGAGQCVLPGPGKTVNGSVAGLVAATDIGYVGLGGVIVTATLANSNFSAQNVPDGAIDALAARVALTFNGANITSVADRVIIRRGINPPAGSTLPVFDFNATEAMTPIARNLTINNIGADQFILGMSYLTGSFAATPLYSEIVQTNAPASRQVPTLNPQAGDLHGVSASTVAGTPPAITSRALLAYFSGSADRTFTLGPAIGAVTVTNGATAPAVRLRSVYTRQPEYNRDIAINYSQQSGGVSRHVTIGMTEGYLQGSATVDHTMADLTGLAGWQAVWSLVQSATSWGLTALNYASASAPLDGLINTLATRQGSITP